MISLPAGTFQSRRQHFWRHGIYGWFGKPDVLQPSYLQFVPNEIFAMIQQIMRHTTNVAVVDYPHPSLRVIQDQQVRELV